MFDDLNESSTRVYREEKKTIPYFNGQHDGKSIHDWLHNAERVEENNEWDDQQKVKKFSDRLTGEALDWHSDRFAPGPKDGKLVSRFTKRAKFKIYESEFTICCVEKCFHKKIYKSRAQRKLRNKLNF